MRQPRPTPTMCPVCGRPVVAPVDSNVPWCPACEWGLDRYDPTTAVFRGSHWLGRWGYRRGFALDETLHRELTAHPDARPSTSASEIVLAIISAVLLVLSLGCVVAIGWVWSVHGDTPVAALGLSVPLVILATWFAPSLGRLPKKGRLAPNSAPALRQVVNAVAASVGSPPPDIIVLDMSLNARVNRPGWRRTSVLWIGVPLWAVLTPPMRVAVLAHEFGHLVNADPMRSRLTWPARSLFARAVSWTGGHGAWARLRTTRAVAGATLLGLFIMAVLSSIGTTAQLLIDAVAMPDSRRAEYLADLSGRRVAGSAASVAAFDRLLLIDPLYKHLWNLVPRHAHTDLSRLVEGAAAGLAGEVPIRRQLSRRHEDLWSSHPPEGMRAALIESLPEVLPSLQIASETWAAVDVELGGFYRRIHARLLGTRDPFHASGS